MTQSATPQVSRQGSLDFPWRGLAFVCAFSLTWITLKPFGNLADAEALLLSTGREVPTYICFALLSGFCLFQLTQKERRALRFLMVPSFAGLGLWIALSCVMSQDISVSLKHGILCGFVALTTACLFLLPRGRLHLATLLAAAAAVLLALSYFGVIFIPQFAIHQATDLGEPSLAGSWRGVFAHKNAASAVFSMIAFIGIYVARAGRTVEGLLICALSVVFVAFSGGKSSSMIGGLTLIVSIFAVSQNFRLTAILAILAPLLALNALGVGSVLSSSLASISASLPLDSTFTGRTDVWKFAIANIPSHTLFGHGFSAFWNTEAIRVAAADSGSWVGEAAHAHNGYLDAALAMGFPGVALTLWAFVIQPLADLRRAMRMGANPALVLMLSQIWLFGIYLSSVESFFFDRADPVWITFLFAVFGLRFIACCKTSPL